MESNIKFTTTDWHLVTIVNAYKSGLKKDFSALPIIVNSRDYQRELVWTLRDKTKLFESLLKGWSTPTITLWKTKDEEGNYFYEVVDGQQRIDAFDKILDSKITKPKNCSLKENELNKKIKSIKIIPIPVMVIESYDKSIAKEYFEIINLAGKKLSNQEVRWSIYNKSDAFKLIDTIYSNKEFTEKFVELNRDVKILNWGNKRKKCEEEIIILYRAWENIKIRNAQKDALYRTDYKKDLDSFFKEYILDTQNSTNFISDLIKFQKSFIEIIKIKDNYHLKKFYYFLIFFVLYLCSNIKIGNALDKNWVHFLSDINKIDVDEEKGIKSEDLHNNDFTIEMREKFMPKRSTTKASRQASHNVFIKYIGEKHG